MCPGVKFIINGPLAVDPRSITPYLFVVNIFYYELEDGPPPIIII